MRRFVVISAAAMWVGGCVACGHKECPVCNPPRQGVDAISAAVGTPVQVYPMPAAELAKHLERALVEQGFTIVSSEGGVIQTDWKSYPGEFHIARRWQERSRFRVTVIPDVANPTTHSRFEVAEETQRRSNDKAKWEEAGRRLERAGQLHGSIAPAVSN